MVHPVFYISERRRGPRTSWARGSLPPTPPYWRACPWVLW